MTELAARSVPELRAALESPLAANGMSEGSAPDPARARRAPSFQFARRNLVQ